MYICVQLPSDIHYKYMYKLITIQYTHMCIYSHSSIQSGSGDYVVRLRGLPYSAQVKDILSLLSDCQVKNGEKGVFFTFTPDGRPSGQAFVELCSEEDVSKALGHNKEHMGKRYVEIFRASRGQMEWDCRLEDKYGGGAGTGVVRLRGLPYRCTEEQVKRFFSGLANLARLEAR